MSIFSNIKRDNPEVNWQRNQILGSELLQYESGLYRIGIEKHLKIVTLRDLPSY